MGLSVHVLCSNYDEDRILARMARALRDRNGWTLSSSAADAEQAEMLFCGVYFWVNSLSPWPEIPVAAYFTHREEEPPGTIKAKVFDEAAKRVALRIVTARMYGKMVEQYGPTVQVHAPVERERFEIPRAAGRGPRNDGARRVVGLSGYTYANKRKGEDLVAGLVGSKIGQAVEWRACGRGWPVPTTRLTWEQMPGFYQGLDVLVCASRVEGIPMPPLEALACGVSVVIPWHVGVLDELGEVTGIYRYNRGEPAGLQRALQRAVDERGEVDREALRGAIEGHSVEAWCGDIERAMESVCGREKTPLTGLTTNERAPEMAAPGMAAPGMAAPGMAGVESEEEGEALPEIVWEEPVERGTGSARGIYCVAFGGPARSACEQMMRSAKAHMPDIPIALCAAEPIGPEDLLLKQPDSDIGGRRAKLRAYELAPAEWQTVLYLDADIKVIAPVYPFFQWVEDGWELAICTDVPPNDLLGHIGHKTQAAEAKETARVVGTGMAVQFNGGVWSFGRGKQVETFFRRWRAEWERWGAKDQGALLRAYHSVPMKTWVLGNEWNCFPRFQPNQESAGLLHFPGDARRWTGQIRGRIDTPEAWDAVAKFERGRRGR